MEYYVQKVNALKERDRLTIRELSEKTNISKTTIHNILNGKANITYEQLKKISKLFDVSIAELLEEKSQAGNPKTKQFKEELEKQKEVIHVFMRLYDLMFEIIEKNKSNIEISEQDFEILEKYKGQDFSDFNKVSLESVKMLVNMVKRGWYMQ